jgi:hypothetical protein
MKDGTQEVLRRAPVVLMLGAFLAIGALWVGPGDNEPFVAEGWRRGDVRARGSMVRDLEVSGLLQGKARAEVLSLLGPPDAICGGEGLVYRVSLDGVGWCPWSCYFIVTFNAADRVASTFLRE